MTSDGLTFETHLGKGNLEKIMSRFNDYLNDSFGKTLEGPVLSTRSLTLLSFVRARGMCISGTIPTE